MPLKCIEVIRLKDFAFIFWEKENKEKTDIHGYPCRSYPQADKFLPALQKITTNIQEVIFYDYRSEGSPFEKIVNSLESDNVLLQWDGITARKDYTNLFKAKKNLYIILHNGLRFGGGLPIAQEPSLRKEITQNSKKVIFQVKYERANWKDLECDKFELMSAPTRTGQQFKKKESKANLGIQTRYAIMCWGIYTDKDYSAMMPWIAEWKDTSLLFCGSGKEDIVREKAKSYNISKLVFFSKHGISDVDADLWFSASDILTCPSNSFGTSTLIHAIGQGKCCVVPINPINKELEEISGVVTCSDLKSTTRELLLNGEKRKTFELKSLEYAKINSYENYAIKICNLMNIKEKGI
jgi:glycosyltransferase involved in cell wall biosynthesis